jgi:hypothetical protein
VIGLSAGDVAMAACEILPGGAVILSLGEGCIQATARRAHRELARALLDDGIAPAPAALAAVETLARFLAETDFPALRARRPELAGGRPVQVKLEPRREGVSWEVVSR